MKGDRKEAARLRKEGLEILKGHEKDICPNPNCGNTLDAHRYDLNLLSGEMIFLCPRKKRVRRAAQETQE